MDQQEPSVIPRLYQWVVNDFFINHLGAVNFLRRGIFPNVGSRKIFVANEEFWAFLRSSATLAASNVLLPDYQLTDWFPRSPGLFHTEEAFHNRESAARHLRIVNGALEYSPGGKTDMISGGIGAVRFKPVKIDGEQIWLCTATSDGTCHGGIPLAIPDQLMREIDLKYWGHYKITGKICFLPDFIDIHFRHSMRIRRMYVVVDSLKQIRSKGRPIVITPMVFFSRDGERNADGVTFVQCAAGLDSELDMAAEWIDGYVQRNGSSIVTNFDQQRPTFQNVPFSLQSVMTNRITLNDLQSVHIERAEVVLGQYNQVFSERTNVANNVSVKIGDNVVIHGDLIVASSIKDSFNRVKDSNSPEALKNILEKLSLAVGKITESLDKESAISVARDLETLTKEATSGKPRQRWWELSVEGIKSAAEGLAGIGRPVLDILAQLAPYFPK